MFQSDVQPHGRQPWEVWPKGLVHWAFWNASLTDDQVRDFCWRHWKDRRTGWLYIMLDDDTSEWLRTPDHHRGWFFRSIEHHKVAEFLFKGQGFWMNEPRYRLVVEIADTMLWEGFATIHTKKPEPTEEGYAYQMREYLLSHKPLLPAKQVLDVNRPVFWAHQKDDGGKRTIVHYPGRSDSGSTGATLCIISPTQLSLDELRGLLVWPIERYALELEEFRPFVEDSSQAEFADEEAVAE